MGISVIGGSSGGGASLPPGATALVASGYATKGFTNVTGSFPAGKYLVKSDSMCTVNFSNGKDVIGYQNSIFGNGGSCIVNVGASSTNIDYVSGYSMEELGANNPNSTLSEMPAFSRGSLFTFRNSTGTSFNQGEFINGRARFWSGSGNASLTGDGIYNVHLNTSSLNLNAWATSQQDHGWDGTTLRGYYSSNTTNFSTTDITSTSWSTNSVSPSDYFPHTYYGGGMWIQRGSGTSYRYSTDGTTWSSGTFPFSLGSSGRKLLAYGNGKWVVIDRNSSTNPYTAYSTNGINWTIVQVGATYTTNTSGSYLNQIVFGNGRFFISGWTNFSATAYSIELKNLVSVDGINWLIGAQIPRELSSSGQPDIEIGYDGVSFILNPTGSNMYRSYTGFDLLPLGFNSQVSYQIKGRWGKFANIGASQAEIQEVTKPGTYFEIYSLDPAAYATY